MHPSRFDKPYSALERRFHRAARMFPTPQRRALMQSVIAQARRLSAAGILPHAGRITPRRRLKK